MGLSNVSRLVTTIYRYYASGLKHLFPLRFHFVSLIRNKDKIKYCVSFILFAKTFGKMSPKTRSMFVWFICDSSHPYGSDLS